MVNRTAQSLRLQIARLLYHTPHNQPSSFCLQRLNWLKKDELREVLELLNDYFLALHEAADLEAQGAKKTKECGLAIEGAAQNWREIYNIFAKAAEPKGG